MKHIYRICKGWDNPTANNTLQVETNKATAKREAKQWAAAVRDNVVIYRDGEFFGVMEFPFFLRECPNITTADITPNFND